MTKLRWEQPPKEVDPSTYDPATDPKLRFVGSSDDDNPKTASRLWLKDRLMALPDEIAFMRGMAKSSQARLAKDRPDLEARASTDTLARLELQTREQMVTRLNTVVQELGAEKLRLEQRLASMPRNDRF